MPDEEIQPSDAIDALNADDRILAREVLQAAVQAFGGPKGLAKKLRKEFIDEKHTAGNRQIALALFNAALKQGDQDDGEQSTEDFTAEIKQLRADIAAQEAEEDGS